MNSVASMPRGREDDAVDPLRAQHLQVLLLAVQVLVAVAQQDGVAPRMRRALDRVDEFGEEGIDDVCDDQAQHAACACAHAARCRVGRISQGLNRLEHALTCRDGDAARVVQHVRNRGRGHGRQARDVTDGGGAGGHDGNESVLTR